MIEAGRGEGSDADGGRQRDCMGKAPVSASPAPNHGGIRRACQTPATTPRRTLLPSLLQSHPVVRPLIGGASFDRKENVGGGEADATLSFPLPIYAPVMRSERPPQSSVVPRDSIQAPPPKGISRGPPYRGLSSQE